MPLQSDKDPRKQTIVENCTSHWKIPRWNQADLALISNGIVSPKECSDPISATLFYALRARSRLLEWRLDRRPPAVKRWLWTWRRTRQESAFIVGSAKAWSLTVPALQRYLQARISSYAESYGRLADPTIVEPTVADVSSVFEGQYCDEVTTVVRELNRDGGFVVVQGSRANGETTSFSDYDLMLFGDISCQNHHVAKRSLDDVVTSCDALQHHGVFFVENNDVSAYWQQQLPVAAYQDALVFGDPRAIEFRVVSERYGAIQTLKGVLDHLDAFLSGDVIVRGLWDWKFKISQFFLVPVLMLASGSVNMPKRDSFDYAKPFYSHNAWDAIRKLSVVRDEWTDDFDKKCYMGITTRSAGRSHYDGATVPDNLALWQKEKFVESARQFLTETRTLVKL